MTPFCSLKQNCNTLLAPFCYSTHLKVIRNGLGVKKKLPWGCASGHPDQQPSINMECSVHLHLHIPSPYPIKLTSFVLPL